MYLGLGRPGGDVVGFTVLMSLGVGVMFAYYATVYSTIHDVVEPSLRGTAMALYFFAMYVLGASLGPVGTGLASDYFTFQKASAAGAVEPLPFGAIMAAELRSLVGESKGFNLKALEPFRAEGLHTAMYIVPILASILAVVLFAASRTVKKDVDRLQTWMKEPAKTSSAFQNSRRPLVRRPLGLPVGRRSSRLRALASTRPPSSLATSRAEELATDF